MLAGEAATPRAWPGGSGGQLQTGQVVVVGLLEQPLALHQLAQQLVVPWVGGQGHRLLQQLQGLGIVLLVEADLTLGGEQGRRVVLIRAILLQQGQQGLA